MDQVLTVARPRRREYSVEFKASAVEECRQPGASLEGIALGHGINPYMVHRWIREDRQRRMLTKLQRTAAAFVPLQLAAAAAVNECRENEADSARPQPNPSWIAHTVGGKQSRWGIDSQFRIGPVGCPIQT